MNVERSLHSGPKRSLHSGPKRSLHSPSYFLPFPLPILAETGLSDIREIVESPNYWPWIVVAALLLATLAVFLWQKRPKRPASTVPAPVEPPDLKALRLLDQLQAKGDELEAEAFTVEVSSILRNYLEDALTIRAPEQTSEEFLQDLRGQSWLTPDLQENLENFMLLSDLVKFARQALSRDQRIRLLDNARQVVDATRPQPETVAS